MYQQIWSDYLSKLKDKPVDRTLYLGQALRYIREESRKNRSSTAQEAKVGISLLKAMETDREAYSTWEKTTGLAQALSLPVERLIQRGREEFPSNFFIQRKDSRLRLDYDGITIYPLSPPIATRSDFLLLNIQLQPQKLMNSCVHEQADEIATYMLEGPTKFQFGEKGHVLKANQSVFFDGAVRHGFINESKEKTVEFFLCLNPPPQLPTTKEKGKIEPRKEGLDLAFALEYVRRKASPVPHIPLPWNMLSEMTKIPLRALMHLKSGKTEIVYWDKLEALAQGTGISLDEIIEIAMGKTEGRLEICSALHRGTFDYNDQFGMKIYSAARPGTSRRKFFIGQMFLSKRASLPSMRRRWRYKTNGFICAVVQDGRVLIEYGARKKEKLSTGDSVYFNADLEFVVHNLEHQDSKLLLFSHPPLF